MFPFKSLFASAALIGIVGCSSNPATIANVNLGRSNSGPFDSDVGPFGFDTLSLIDPETKYDYCELTDNTTFPYLNYRCSTAPNPHPDMDHYELLFHKETEREIIAIVGIGKDIQDSGRGDKVRAKVDELADQVKSKHGPWQEKIDTGKSESTYPDDWMISLLRKQNGYGYAWESNEILQPNYINPVPVYDDANEPFYDVDINDIVIAARSFDRSIGHVVIAFSDEITASNYAQ